MRRYVSPTHWVSVVLCTMESKHGKGFVCQSTLVFLLEWSVSGGEVPLLAPADVYGCVNPPNHCSSLSIDSKAFHDVFLLCVHADMQRRICEDWNLFNCSQRI